MTNKYLTKIAANLSPSREVSLRTGSRALVAPATERPISHLGDLVKNRRGEYVPKPKGILGAISKHPVKAGLIGAGVLGAAGYGIKKLKED